MEEITPQATPPEQEHAPNPLLIIASFAVLGLAVALILFGGQLLVGQPAPEQSGGVTVPQSGSGDRVIMPGDAIQVGDRAPAFALADVNGNRVALADFQGQPVILNFWATWCPPCRLEMPDLQAAYERHQEDNLAILAINQDEPQDLVTSFFYDVFSLTFTPLLDQNAVVGDMYGAFNLPTSVFIDAEGTITAIQRSFMTGDQIEQFLAKTIQNG